MIPRLALVAVLGLGGMWDINEGNNMPEAIGIPKEVFPGEKRVAMVPDVVQKLMKLGFVVAVQSGAGEAASIGDDAYRAAGASIVPDAAGLWSQSDIVFKVRAPSRDELNLMRDGGRVFSDLTRIHADPENDNGDVPLRNYRRATASRNM